jgi:hypothetical protein
MLDTDLTGSRPADWLWAPPDILEMRGRLGRFRTADLYRVKVALSH